MIKEFFSKKLLEEIRSKFHYVEHSPYAGQRIFFDSVSGALRLKKMGEEASREIVSYAQKKRVDPASDHFAEVKKRFKKDAKLFFGAESGYIIPAMSGTHTVFRCVNAVCAEANKGDNIVTTNLDHPAAFESTSYFSKKYNLERKVAKFDKDKGYVSQKSVLGLIDENTKLLMIIHGSNVTGAVNDIENIVEKARHINPDIYVVVDGVQYAPHRLIDVEKLNVDAYVISGYKIFCKKASGIGYINNRFDNLPHWQFSERPKGEWAIGAEDESTYAGFSKVVEYLQWLGSQFTEKNDPREKIEIAMKKISAHTKALMRLALDGDGKRKSLRQMENIKLLGIEEDIEDRTGLISFKIKEKNSNEIAQKYFNEARISVSTRERNVYARHILQGLEVDDLIRVSICHYNSPYEIKRFLDFTEKLQQRH